MAARARSYVRPIAVRYVQSHQQYLFQIQAIRRTPGAVDAAPVHIPATPNPDLFNDDEWKLEFGGIEVQEMDGLWRSTTLFRHSTNTSHVYIWYGGEEYEGIDPESPYTFDPRSETLEDDEGFDINWRTIGVENETDSDDEDE